MPDIRPDFRYTISLTKAEIRLVGLALIGRVGHDERVVVTIADRAVCVDRSGNDVIMTKA